MSWQTDVFSFAGAHYLLLPTSRNRRVPKPHTETAGAWVHTPYGGNTFVSDDNATLHTPWQADIVIPYGTIDEDTHYGVFDGLRNRFGSLLTPWGTFNARLANLSVQEDTAAGGYIGTATWEWG